MTALTALSCVLSLVYQFPDVPRYFAYVLFDGTNYLWSEELCTHSVSANPNGITGIHDKPCTTAPPDRPRQ